MDSYMLLRRLILDSCVFDVVPRTGLSAPYEDRIDRGESPNVVIRDCIRHVIPVNTTWTVRVGHQTYQLHIKAKVAGEIFSKLRPAQRDDAKYRNAAKKILRCIASLESVLRDGVKSRFLANDDRPNRHGVIKHKGWKWIYVYDFVEGADVEGAVMVQMGFLPGAQQNTKTPPKNIVYNIITDENTKFPDRQKMADYNQALEGEVSFVLNG